MSEKHYKRELSAFLDKELSRDEQHEIAEHLIRCALCRREHDRLRLGATLAGRMEPHDAPAGVWTAIESAFHDKRSPQMTLMAAAPRFGYRNLAGYAVAVLVVAGLVSVAYFILFRGSSSPTVTELEMPAATAPEQAPPPGNAAVEPDQLASVEQQNANTGTSITNSNFSTPETAAVSAWQFETISGAPRVGNASSSSTLAVGDFLETDAVSRARLEVADIGSVEIKPNSLVKLVRTNAKQHRLSLERGVLEAQILAPPRLFIVDTPSAVAVDLGCSYKLEVDKAGNSYLHVTSGFVALERGGRESIVPAGAMCLTKKGKGLGTPFSADTTDTFRAALERFDFSNGGSRALQTMLDNRNFFDIITFWHLLSRVTASDREKVFDALSTYVQPPADVTREGILTLDKKMLASWRAEVERVWFE